MDRETRKRLREQAKAARQQPAATPPPQATVVVLPGILPRPVGTPQAGPAIPVGLIPVVQAPTPAGQFIPGKKPHHKGPKPKRVDTRPVMKKGRPKFHGSRLPHNSLITTLYNAFEKEWAGSLTVAPGCVGAGRYEARAPTLFTTCQKLDRLWRSAVLASGQTLPE